MNCPICQAQNPDQAKFCMNCGGRLFPGQAAAEGASNAKPAFDLDRYLPHELLAKLEAARTRNTIVGERRVITMLFCDVKGSTAAAEKVDPEIWTDIINGAFEYMIRPVYRYEGLVPRLMGDAILAFFGAPIAHEDDPQRAVLAGLEIQQGIQSYAREIRFKYGLEFGLRVGINTGLVVVGEVGSDLRLEYTAIGDAINLAARMEQTAPVGTVQISEDTYKLTAPFFDVEALGEIELKGKIEPVKAFRVLGLKAAPGHLRGLDEVMGRGLSSPLVGREAQLALLQDGLERLKSGAGSCLSVVGEAGLGKSTLIAQLMKSNAGSPIVWLRGDALSYASSISYFPWRQVIRQSIDAREGEPPSEVRGKLQYACDCCTLPGGDLPFLEAMLAIESQESLQVVAGYQGEALVQRIEQATRGYLCGLAAQGPLALVFDDVHWADAASLNLLIRLADLARTQPILLLCLLRPETAAPGWDAMIKIEQALGERYHSLLLGPLPVEQTDLLLTNLLGVRDLPKNIRALILEKADGNPFFIEEVIRSLIETKQLVHASGRWQAAGGEAKISLPDTLRGVLHARIDRLAEMTRDVLQNAAVIGRKFDLRILKRLTGLNAELDPHLRHLAAAGLIESAPEECSFRHVLIQEAAYDSILLKNRVRLHRLIGEMLEQMHAGRIDEFAPLLAYHFYSAGDGRSLGYDVLAGEKAARLYANTEAAAHFRRALEVARREAIDPGGIARLFAQSGQALELSGRYDSALQNYDEMQAFGSQNRDRSTELAALMAKATLYSTYTSLHDPARAEQTLLQALELSSETGDRAAQAKLHWNLMLTFLFSKRLQRAREHGERALALARANSVPETLAFVLNDLCRLYTCLGEFENAFAAVQEARGLWHSLNNQTMLADSFGSEAEARFQSGDYTKALELLQQGLRLSEKIENLWGKAYTRMLISFIYFDTGEIGRAIQLSLEAVAEGDQAGLVATSTGHRAELGWFYACYGDIGKGFELVQQAIEIAEAKQPDFKALPQAIQVRLHLLNGDLEAAQRAAGPAPLEPIAIPYARYTIIVCLANAELALAQKEPVRALDLLEDLLTQVRPLTRVDIPEVLCRKAEALIGMGKPDEARHVLTEACSLAEGLGSDHHLWSALSGLADVNARLGRAEEADACRRRARPNVERIAEGLRELGLSEPFLNLPRVEKLFH